MSPPPVPGSTRGRAPLLQRLRTYLPDLVSFAGALLVAALGALLLAALPGCGGGVGGEGTGSFASGTISGYGSIIVNGVHFDEAVAERLDDEGKALASEDLALGMVVQVSAGAIQTDASGRQSAVARSVRTQRALVGPLSGAPDLAAGRLSVLGQTVLVSADTVFDARLAGGLAGLAEGQRIEVYGFYDVSRAAFSATRIAPAAVAGAWVSGPVLGVDTGSGSVTLGGQRYTLAAGTSLSGLNAGSVVRLDLAATGTGSHWELRARSLADGAMPSDRDGAELDGLVGALLSPTRFVVNGVTVDSASAQVDGEVVVGARVAVGGALRNGVLQAATVRVLGAGVRQFELNGSVSSLDAAAQRFVLRGTTVSFARVDLRIDGGSLAALAVGRRLRVEGVLSADRTVLEATRIRFDG